jgi:hypothetical protein
MPKNETSCLRQIFVDKLRRSDLNIMLRYRVESWMSMLEKCDMYYHLLILTLVTHHLRARKKTIGSVLIAD